MSCDNIPEPAPGQWLIASANPHKARELREIVEPIGVEVRTLADLNLDGQVEEDQETLEGNALKKARYWHDRSGWPVLADDTGLEVDALDGAPGVYSARYAGNKANDRRNVSKLLREMEGMQNRAARFRTVIARVNGSDERTYEGICRGSILHEPTGEGGFGYDPVFRPEGEERSFAELLPEEKNRISHRGRALQALRNDLADHPSS
ncbi:MAG: RdgB/HAM1 family non-canonical purine NTP pyrophosphatase [Bacteroidota bacterium]